MARFIANVHGSRNWKKPFNFNSWTDNCFSYFWIKFHVPITFWWVSTNDITRNYTNMVDFPDSWLYLVVDDVIILECDAFKQLFFSVDTLQLFRIHAQHTLCHHICSISHSLSTVMNKFNIQIVALILYFYSISTYIIPQYRSYSSYLFEQLKTL